MSVKMSAACKQIDYAGAKRAVLLEFADHANDDGICWPSRSRIMYNTGLSESSVKQQMRELREAEILTVVDHHEGGRGRVPIYKVQPEKGPQKIPFSEWCEQNEKGSNPGEKGSDSAERGQLAPERGQSVPPEPSVTVTEQSNKSVESNDSRAKPRANGVVSMNKYVVDAIYAAMREAGYRMPNEDYKFHLGRAQDMLDKDGPTDDEIEALPEAFVKVYEIKGRADAASALVEMRRQAARARRIEGTAADEIPGASSPPAVVEALKTYDRDGVTDLRAFARLAERWDFTSDEEPPFKILARLGGTDEERDSVLRRVRSVARKVMRDSGDAA